MQGVADQLWYDTPYQWQPSADYAMGMGLAGGGRIPAGVADPGYYRLGVMKNGAFNWMPYSFHQYMRGSGRTMGLDPGYYGTNDRGIVCSQVPAWASSKKFDASNRTIGGRISHTQYEKQATANAGVALWHAVAIECANGLGFWEVGVLELLNLVGAGPSASTVCKRAAWQVLNCFFKGGECNDTSIQAWESWVADPNQRIGATSLSPDGLLGWGHFPTSGGGVSPWANYVPNQLQWNGAGNVYRCWY
jgi:hypothetical protein